MQKFLSALVAVVFILLAGIAVANAAKSLYQIDAKESDFAFFIKIPFSKINGNFKKFSGELEYTEQSSKPLFIRATIDAGSVIDVSGRFTSRMRSEEFFDVAKYKTAHFTSISSKKLTQDSGIVVGNLTLHGVTREVEFKYFVDKNTAELFVVRLQGVINRRDFGISGLAVIVGDEVNFNTKLYAKPIASSILNKSNI